MKKKIKSMLIGIMLFSYILTIVLSLANKDYITGNVSDTQNIIVNINLEPEYYELSPGDNLIANAKILQLGNKDSKNILINSYLRGEYNESYKINSRSLSLETQTSVIVAGSIPEELKNGRYFLVVEIIDSSNNEKIAEASQNILVKKELLSLSPNSQYAGKYSIKSIILLIALILILIIAIIFYINLHKGKLKKYN